MATTPYVDELVRRIALDDAGVTVDCDADGLCTVVWPERSQAHPIVLLVGEADLGAAVTSCGDEWRDRIGPGSTLDDTGFRLLLVHVQEIRATRDTTEPLRITADGVEWPEERLPSGDTGER